MKIIVLAHPRDDHAAPVQWALRQAGYQTACWGGVSWTEEERASLFLDGSPRMLLGRHCLESDDVVWLRQPDPPMPLPTRTPQNGSERERGAAYPAFFEALAYMLELLPVRCVNSYSASCRVRNKGLQLQLALASGLRVPATCMSNSPAAVRGFFDQNPDNAICKSFASHIWQQQGAEEISVTETFSLNREQLPSEDEIFTYAPAIYQQKVAKQFDVRMVLMGRRIYSFALHTPANSLDWRHEAVRGKLRAESIVTPAHVADSTLRFAEKAGVCFGSLDFAVDRQGEWWFLEINEQGQFLWLDQVAPAADLQQKFCAFLTAPPDAMDQLEDRQDLFPSHAAYRRAHPKEKFPDITQASADAPFKSME